MLLLFTVPFLVNYIIRAFAWTWLLGRTGLINALLIATGLTSKPLDWLLYSDVAVLIGLVTSYMPFMIFPLWVSLAGIDRRLIQASWMLGAPPARTFLRVTLPLSLPGVFAAAIFSFVSCFGESAIPVVIGRGRLPDDRATASPARWTCSTIRSRLRYRPSCWSP